MSLPSSFDAFVVDKQGDSVQQTIESFAPDQLPAGDVTIAIEYSAINYKDALAATAHPGVAKNLPLIPGIDAVGKVLASGSDRFRPGDQVLVAHAEFGTSAWGGWSQLAQVPESWVLPLPSGLDALSAVTLGTAGFTAAQCVRSLLHHNVKPEDGEIIVSGATGGVGCFAVWILAQRGYQVVASTGKLDQSDWLKDLGAARVVDRKSIVNNSDRPLLASTWAGAVDTVGGETLASIIRATRPNGCVTACGLVGGHQLQLTVYPFILRGVTLQGIDSASLQWRERERIWSDLAQSADNATIKSLAQIIKLGDLTTKVAEILAGKIAGRVVVDLRK